MDPLDALLEDVRQLVALEKKASPGFKLHGPAKKVVIAMGKPYRPSKPKKFKPTPLQRQMGRKLRLFGGH